MRKTSQSFIVLAIALAAWGCESENAATPTECPNGATTGAGVGGGGGDTSTEATTTGVGGGSTGSGMVELPTPQEIAARLHGCRKIRYSALGTFLAERGVDLVTFGGSGSNCQNDANGPFCNAQSEQCYCPSPPCSQNGSDPGNQGTCVAKPATAGFLYQTAKDAFGVPKQDSRQGEKDGHTTASAMRLMDLFVQAAPQIIANIENDQLAPACVLNGESFPMFDPVDGSCVEESISCLIGYPATEDHLLLCNLIVDQADPGDPADLQKKRIIAVATLLSAAHSCE
jgi:hypothetical protein